MECYATDLTLSFVVITLYDKKISNLPPCTTVINQHKA